MASAAAAADEPPVGKVVEARIMRVRAWRDPKKAAVGAEILATARDGAPLDWAATAVAIADAAAASGPLDFVTVDLQDADLAGLPAPADYKHLAIVYFGKTPPKSPWEDDPFAVFPASRRTSREDAARVADYEAARGEALARTRNPDLANREAAAKVARSHGLTAWSPPPDNQAGAKSVHRREELRVDGGLAPITLLALQLCLRNPKQEETWGCPR